MRDWRNGAILINLCVMGQENTLAMKTVTDFAKCMSTRWKATGRCCDPGFVPTGESRKKNCRATWDSSSSFITLGNAAKRC